MSIPFLPVQLSRQRCSSIPVPYSDNPFEMKILDLERVIWLEYSRGSKCLEADIEKLPQFCADYTVIYCNVNSLRLSAPGSNANDGKIELISSIWKQSFFLVYLNAIVHSI